jgi:hypothetical protein
MKYHIQSGLVLMAGVLGAATGTGHADHDAAGTYGKSHMREAILRSFFRESRSPVEGYAEAFVQEADAHHLDWRLLPSLAFVESGGGQKNRRNNIFGWDNGASHFSTAAEAIHHVAEALSEARPYKGKDLAGKLAAYNPTPGYLRLITSVMERISSVPVLEAAK